MGQVVADRFEGGSGRPATEISVVDSASGCRIRAHSIQRLDAEVKTIEATRWPCLNLKWAVWPFWSDQKPDDLAPLLVFGQRQRSQSTLVVWTFSYSDWGVRCLRFADGTHRPMANFFKWAEKFWVSIQKNSSFLLFVSYFGVKTRSISLRWGSASKAQAPRLVRS